MPNLTQRLERLPFLSSHKWLVGILTVCYFFELSDLNTFGYAAPVVIKEWHKSVGAVSFATSAGFAGLFAGAFLGGLLSSWIGRRKSFLLSLALYSIASLISASASSIIELAFFRILTGLGLSSLVVVGNTYVVELFPSAVRGRMLALIMTISLCGIPATAWAARWFVTLGPNGWRFIFVWGSLGLLALPVALRFLPESPRWLERKGNYKVAREIVERLETEATTLGHNLQDLPTQSRVAGSDERLGALDLFRKGYGWRTSVLLVVSMACALGFYGFIAWVPTLLAKHGFTIEHSLAYSSFMSLCNPLGAGLAFLLIERLERKTFIGAAAIAICGVILIYGLATKPVEIVILGAIVVFLLQFATVGNYTYFAESFPTDIRSTAVGVIYGAGRLANVFGAFIVGALFTGFGYYSVYVYIAVCYGIAALFVLAFGLRTTGRQLENIGNAVVDAFGDGVESVDAEVTR